MPLQAKVLKAVEDQRIRRLGANREIPVDVRIIAATHQDLRQLIREGRFREDLYHRLDLYRLRIPPLRERGQELLALAERLIEGLCQRHRVPVKRISAMGRERMLAYGWPGNVRELAHELERGIVFEERETLQFTQLQPQEGVSGSGGPEWFNSNYLFPTQGFSLEEATNYLIQQALKQSNQNVSAAARLLGVSRDFIRYRLQGKEPKE
jgi:DNA-binding NtrC family response regulator